MMGRVKPENMNKPATPKQKLVLFKSTKLRWTQTDITMGDASEIIGTIKEGDPYHALSMIQKYFPDFTGNEFIPSSPMGEMKPDVKPEPEPEAKPDEAEASEPEIKTPMSTKKLDDILGMLNDTLVKEIKGEIETIAKGIAKKYSKPAKPTFPGPTGVDYIKPRVWDRVYAWMQCNNILLTGPAGCGKTLMCSELAKAQNLPYYALSCAGGMRYSQLIGTKELVVNADGNQVTKFVPSRFLEVIQEPGITLLDEVFAIDPDALQGLNGILDYGTRGIRTPDGNFIKVHPEHKLMAAANTNGRSVSRKYTAPQIQDASVLSRFLTVPMDYDLTVESKILVNAKIPEDARDKLANTVGTLRSAIKTHQIGVDIGTREITSAIRAYQALPDIDLAIEAAFLSKFSDAERAKLNM